MKKYNIDFLLKKQNPDIDVISEILPGLELLAEQNPDIGNIVVVLDISLKTIYVILDSNIKKFLNIKKKSNCITLEDLNKLGLINKEQLNQILNEFKNQIENNPENGLNLESINQLIQESIINKITEITYNKDEIDAKFQNFTESDNLKQNITEKITEIIQNSNLNLDNYYNKEYINSLENKINESIENLKKSIPNNENINEKIKNIEEHINTIKEQLKTLNRPDINLDNYYNKQETENKIQEKIQELQIPDVSNFITDVRLSEKLNNYYNKQETLSNSEIEQKLTEIKKLIPENTQNIDLEPINSEIEKLKNTKLDTSVYNEKIKQIDGEITELKNRPNTPPEPREPGNFDMSVLEPYAKTAEIQEKLDKKVETETYNTKIQDLESKIQENSNKKALLDPAEKELLATKESVSNLEQTVNSNKQNTDQNIQNINQTLNQTVRHNNNLIDGYNLKAGFNIQHKTIPETLISLDLTDDKKLKLDDKIIATTDQLTELAKKSEVVANETLDLYLKKSEAIGSDPTQISKLVNDTIDNNLDKINANDQKFFPAMKLVVNGILKQHGLNIPRGKPKGEIRNTILEFELLDSKTDGNKILNNVRIYKDDKQLYLKTFKKENFRVEGEVECIFSTEKPAWNSYVNSFGDTPVDYELLENEVKGIVSWTESSDIWYTGLAVFSQNPGESYQYYSGKGNKAKLTIKLENFYPDSVVYNTFNNGSNHGTLKLNFKALVNDNFELINLDKIFDTKIDTTFKFPTKHQEEYDRIDFAGYDLSNLDSSIDEKIQQKFIDSRFVEKTNLKQRVSEEIDVITSEEPYNTKLKNTVVEKFDEYLSGNSSGKAFAKISKVVDDSITDVIGKKASANTVIPQARYIINKTLMNLGIFKAFSKPKYTPNEAKFHFLLQDASGSSYGVGLMNVAFYDKNKRLYVNKIRKTKWVDADGSAEFILSENKPSTLDCTTLPEFTDSYELQPGEIKGKVEWDVTYGVATYSGLHSLSYTPGHPYYYMNSGKGDANVTFTLYNFLPSKITYANGDSDRYSKKITIKNTLDNQENGLVVEDFINKGSIFKELVFLEDNEIVGDLIIKDLNLDKIDETLDKKVDVKFKQAEYVEKALLNQKVDSYLDERKVTTQEFIGLELKKILDIQEPPKTVGTSIPLIKKVTGALLKDSGIYIPTGKPSSTKNLKVIFNLIDNSTTSYGGSISGVRFYDNEDNPYYLKYANKVNTNSYAGTTQVIISRNETSHQGTTLSTPDIPENYNLLENEYKVTISWPECYGSDYYGWHSLGRHGTYNDGYMNGNKNPTFVEFIFEDFYPSRVEFNNSTNGGYTSLIELVVKSENDEVAGYKKYKTTAANQVNSFVFPTTPSETGIDIIKQNIDEEIETKINLLVKKQNVLKKAEILEIIENRLNGWGYGNQTEEGRLRNILANILKPYEIDVPLIKPESGITKVLFRFNCYEGFKSEYGPCIANIQIYDSEGNKLYISKIHRETAASYQTKDNSVEVVLSKIKPESLNTVNAIISLPKIPKDYQLGENEYLGKISWQDAYDSSYYYGYQAFYPDDIKGLNAYAMSNTGTSFIVNVEINNLKPKKIDFINGYDSRFFTKARLSIFVDTGDIKNILVNNTLFLSNQEQNKKFELDLTDIL